MNVGYLLCLENHCWQFCDDKMVHTNCSTALQNIHAGTGRRLGAKYDFSPTHSKHENLFLSPLSNVPHFFNKISIFSNECTSKTNKILYRIASKEDHIFNFFQREREPVLKHHSEKGFWGVLRPYPERRFKSFIPRVRAASQTIASKDNVWVSYRKCVNFIRELFSQLAIGIAF